MKNLIKYSIASLLTITSSMSFAKEVGPDPFKDIEYIKLDNGMSVYLSPSEDTNLTSIRVEVDVGWESENKTNWGMSHLLEHVLFRDKQLKEEMSYLQIIKEAGGTANGQTQARTTSYYGSISSAKGSWLLENFSKMILSPKIENEYVQKEKGTVELEIGTPSPIAKFLGRSPGEFIVPSYLHAPTFWETEFGIKEKRPFTEIQEQLSNQRLTVEQIQKQYNDYYYPSNMRLFVAGKYDRAAMMKIINSTWGANKARTGLSLKPKPTAVPRLKPYTKTSVAEGNSTVYLGTKTFNMNLQEEEVVSAYTKFLAHKLMKELRNRLAQTYTASTDDVFEDGTFGYTYVQFQSPKENLDKNMAFAKSFMDKDINKGLSAEDVKEAINLVLSEYQLRGREASAMLGFAMNYASIQHDYGKYESPYNLLQNTTPEEFNRILKKYYTPENRYTYIYRPPLLFTYDYLIFYAISAVVTFSLLRSFLTKEFKNDHVRWIRKIKYPPLKMLETFALLCAWYAYVHFAFGVDILLGKFDVFESNLFIGTYLSGAMWIASFLTAFEVALSLLPRKLMVMDDQLVIKTVSYYSKKIPLSEIESVETMRTITYPFPVSKWIMKIGYRYHFYSLKFWKEGLVVNLKNGKSYFFSVESAKQCQKELSGFLPVKEESIIDINSAA